MNQGLRAVPSMVTSIARVVPVAVVIVSPLPRSIPSAVASVVSLVRTMLTVSTSRSIPGATWSISRPISGSVLVAAALIVP